MKSFTCTNSVAPLVHVANEEKQHKEVMWAALGDTARKWQRWSLDNQHGSQILCLFPTILFLLLEMITYWLACRVRGSLTDRPKSLSST